MSCYQGIRLQTDVGTVRVLIQAFRHTNQKREAMSNKGKCQARHKQIIRDLSKDAKNRIQLGSKPYISSMNKRLVKVEELTSQVTVIYGAHDAGDCSPQQPHLKSAETAGDGVLCVGRSRIDTLYHAV